MLSLAVAALSFSAAPTACLGNAVVQRTSTLKCQLERDGQWQFRHGPGCQERGLGMEPSIDKSVPIMIVHEDTPRAPPPVPAELPAANVQAGVVEPVYADDVDPMNAFRYGPGGGALSSGPAIDGSVAMINMQ